MRKHLKINKGFTLIELLVVIGVIGVLVALAVPNFFAARERARDSQRKSDLKSIQEAMELYKDDQALVQYPPNAVLSTCGSAWTNASTGIIYMKKIPCDPGDGVTPYIYVRLASDTLRYTLTACIENQSDPDKDSVDLCTVGNMANRVSYTISEP